MTATAGSGVYLGARPALIGSAAVLGWDTELPLLDLYDSESELDKWVLNLEAYPLPVYPLAVPGLPIIRPRYMQRTKILKIF